MNKRKGTSATAWFEAQGRRAYSFGLPLNFKRHEHRQWPMWARCAWARGWLYQQPAHKPTESIADTEQTP